MTRVIRRGLIEAVNDPNLLGLVKPWPRQRELLAAVESGPRIHVWALGRRSGKTTMAAEVGLWDATMRPELDALVRKGETRYCVAIATNRQQARILVDAARSIAERSPVLRELIADADADSIGFELPNGARTRLAAFPCNSRGGRGWPISTFIMDEAAHFLSETEGPQVAEKVWAALLPSTAQFGDLARVLVLSTPYGQTGLFHDLYHRAASGEHAEMAAHHAATADVNPTISRDFLTLEEQRDSETFKSEYLAQFVGSGDAYIDLSRVSTGATEATPEQGTDWVAGLDPAFSRDPFGLALVGRSVEDAGKLIVGPVRALRPGGDFGEPLDHVAGVMKKFNARGVTDQHYSSAVIERLRSDGLTVTLNTMGPTTKTDAYATLRAKLYAGLELPDDPALIAELSRLRTVYRPGSAGVRYARTGDSHGDRAQALALAVHALRTKPRIDCGPVSITTAETGRASLKTLY